MRRCSLNEDKTKYMLMGRMRNGPEAVVFFIFRTTEKVASFIYLGVLITDGSNNSKEIGARILKRDRCLCMLHSILK